jgi:beta-barrel assembly-enhancing protease
MKRFTLYTVTAVSMGLLLSMCKPVSQGGGFNLFTIDQDRQLGAQVATEIDSNPKEYPVLDSASNKEVYAYVYKVRNNILNSGSVHNKDEFKWRVRIIKNDSTLNAFCTPGGYIYVYTGILKYLDNEAQLAGVLGHEIGHADLRHSTRQMTKIYGIDALLSIIAGDRQLLRQVTQGIIGLKFSRDHETEADEASVRYLCPTSYPADAGAGFFEKIQSAGGSRAPEFLSTHPDPANRIEHFHEAKAEQGCQGASSYDAQYKAMVKKLP